MRKNLIILFQMIIIISLINSIISKSKKKKHKKDKKDDIDRLPNGLPTPESVRPNYVTPELFCETCRAIVKEAVKELRTKTKESDVIFYLDNVCDENKYTRYQHVPRDIKITCSTFMGIYEEELIKLLTKRRIDETKEELARQLCDETTELCKGVEVNLFKNMQKIEKNGKISTEIDGEPVNIEYHSTKNETDKNKNNEEELKNKKKKKIKKAKHKDSDL